jgi:enoyl-CoA hydratase/carnithine racemase
VTELVALEIGRVARLELVNPPLNLVTRALLDELAAALATLAAASPGDVRAVVVSGRGERAFSAGSHVGEFEDQRGPAAASGTSWSRASRAGWPSCRCRPSPRSRATRSAVGSSCALRDLRIASERARLGLPRCALR